MKFIHRELQAQVLRAAKSFPAVILTGPRRAGKTSLLKRLFPGAEYFLLEAPDIISRLRSDPQGFLDAVKTPAILDEVQNVPEVFGYLRSRIDANPRHKGQWLLTGSQEAPLMQGVTESMAGRAAILQLLPLSARETPKVSMFHGGFPEVLARPSTAGLWFSSYLQTYIERDVRAITAVKDLSTFRRFLALVASRHGQMLNKTDIAAPLGVSVPTVTQWLGILETTAQIIIVPPYYENFGKRLVKTPKVFIADPGLACHLLGIDTLAELNKSPFLGSLFEGLVAAEIIKTQLNRGGRRALYYFRDEQGLEVDFVVPAKNGATSLIECKAGQTVMPAMASSLVRLAGVVGKRSRTGTVNPLLVYRGPAKTGVTTRAILPGVRVMSWVQFVDEFK